MHRFKVDKAIIKILLAILVIIFLSFSFYSPNVANASEQRNNITYQVHVQDISWQKEVTENQIAGTTGKALQLEAIKINNTNTDFKLKYQVHIENLGWQDWKNQGQVAGTTGKALQLEAIKIEIENLNSNKYKVQYRVHIENLGWQDLKENGQMAGTTGKALQIEAIEIKIIPINTTSNLSVEYVSHIENIDWEKKLNYNGDISGTTGKNLRNEALKIRLVNAPYGAEVKYNVYIANRGWQGYKKDGEIAGTVGQALKLEAIKIELVGLENYNVKYKVHIENLGWQDLKQNGQIAGIPGSNLKIEAIQIMLELKDNNVQEKIKEGIDVSHHQGTIDWKKVKNDGIDFAIIRAGYRGYGETGTLNIDRKFDYNIKNATANNIDVGIYFFSQARTVEEAIEEANYTINLIKKYEITYPVVIDVEYANEEHSGRADGISKQLRTQIVIAFCKRIKEAGYTPMYYTDKWFLTENLEVSKLQEYEYWLAHYTGATRENPLKKPSDYKGKYAIWQYTNKGLVDGIDGYVDMNILIN